MKLTTKLFFHCQNIGDRKTPALRIEDETLQTILPQLLQWLSQASMKNHFQLLLCRSKEDLDNCLERRENKKNVSIADLDFDNLMAKLIEEQATETNEEKE